MNVNYRKLCLQLVDEQIRENIEQRYLTTTCLDQAAQNCSYEGLNKKQALAYKKFMKARIVAIAKEVYNEKIEETIGKIMVDMTSIAGVFSDEEMRQIYEISKSPLGMKIIRNLDIMRNAVREGLFIMGATMVQRWRSAENVKLVEDFLFEIQKR